MEYFESLYLSYSREAEIEKILNCIKSGNFNQTISIPGVGLSNLLGLLAYNKAIREKHLKEEERFFHFVLCNFSEIRGKNLSHALEFLFLSLSDSLRERKMTEESSFIDSILKNIKGSNDNFVLFHGLKRVIEYLTLEKNLKIIFLFDRLEEYLPMLTREFFADLKILRNMARYKFSTVFALNKPLENILDPEIIADVYEFIVDHKVYLPISDKPSLDFRVSFIEKTFGKKLPKKSFDQIIQLTNGHGKLTRLCVETMLEANEPKLKLEEFLLSQKSIQNALLEIWTSLNPLEQKLLTNDQRPTTKDHNLYLENVGLLKNGEITIKLFEDFLKQNPQARKVDIEKLLLSDKLTSFEYNLLKFLLQNKDRVIERNEIINSVWKESKSTAGVTDQALDQLIFRVRHKIESDPNNPTHLLTVKGRGFRFIK